MSKLTFVTCIYDDLFGTEFGGRPHPTRKYFYGLESAMKMNSHFVIFTWQKDVERVSEYFKNFLGEDKFNETIKVVEYDLYNTPIREVIKKEKEQNNKIPGDRCQDVMIGKFLMIKNSIEKNYFNSETFFWIDSGLSNSSLFPNKYLDLESRERRYSSCSLFTPKVVDHLLEKSDDKILLIKMNEIGYWFNKSHLSPGDGTWYIIGGLFGGKKDVMNSFCDDSINCFLDHLQNKQTLYTEEQIMTIIRSFDKERFNIIEFEVWHHENSGDWVQGKIIGKRNFYKIFEEFNL